MTGYNNIILECCRACLVIRYSKHPYNPLAGQEDKWAGYRDGLASQANLRGTEELTSVTSQFAALLKV